jgi:hypothetical protein
VRENLLSKQSMTEKKEKADKQGGDAGRDMFGRYPFDGRGEPAVSQCVVRKQRRCEFVERNEGQVLAG